MAGFFGFLGKAVGTVAKIATSGAIGGSNASSKKVQTTLASQAEAISKMQAQLTAQAQGKTGFPWLPIVIGAAIAIPFFLFMRKRR